MGQNRHDIVPVSLSDRHGLEPLREELGRITEIARAPTLFLILIGLAWLVNTKQHERRDQKVSIYDNTCSRVLQRDRACLVNNNTSNTRRAPEHIDPTYNNFNPIEEALTSLRSLIGRLSSPCTESSVGFPNMMRAP